MASWNLPTHLMSSHSDQVTTANGTAADTVITGIKGIKSSSSGTTTNAMTGITTGATINSKRNATRRFRINENINFTAENTKNINTLFFLTKKQISSIIQNNFPVKKLKTHYSPGKR